MLSDLPYLFQPRLAKAAGLVVGALFVAWTVSNWIIAGDTRSLLFAAIAGAALTIFINVLKNWQHGIYLFIVWLVFEDLIRKFGGNGFAMFFAKDAILGITYFSMLVSLRARRLLTFQSPFFVGLGIFFAIGVVQSFNLNSPGLLYSALGLKTYFYYVPMMFAGYAMLRTEADLRKILMVNTWIALTVAGIGVVQSVLGQTFLNPDDLAPDLQTLGRDAHYSPLTHLRVERMTSVYVSDGRFAEALILFFILGMGTAGYLLLRNSRGRNLVLVGVGTVVLATVMEGVRHAFIAILVSAVVLVAAIMWGSGRTAVQFIRAGRAIRLALTFAALALLFMTFLYPDAIKARWALYSETLTPGAAKSELGYRAWDFPVQAVQSVFNQPNWEFGNGIGAVSLGTQYVSAVLGTPKPSYASESGYGALILEFGIIGPFIWILWTSSLLICAWKVVRKLKRTPLFPIGFAIFFYALYVLVLGFFYSLPIYQNYLSNAYLWLTLGMLFRLPGLLEQHPAFTAPVAAPDNVYVPARA